MSLGLHSFASQQTNFSCASDSYITNYILVSKENIFFTICGVKELWSGQFTKFTKSTLSERNTFFPCISGLECFHKDHYHKKRRTVVHSPLGIVQSDRYHCLLYFIPCKFGSRILQTLEGTVPIILSAVFLKHSK
jgi:hypothetical protein